MKLAFEYLEFTEAAVQDARGSLALIGFASGVWNVGVPLPVPLVPTVVAAVDELPESDHGLPQHADLPDIQVGDSFTVTIRMTGPDGEVAFHQSLPSALEPITGIAGVDARARLTIVLPVAFNVTAPGTYVLAVTLTDTQDRTIATKQRRLHVTNKFFADTPPQS